MNMLGGKKAMNPREKTKWLQNVSKSAHQSVWWIATNPGVALSSGPVPNPSIASLVLHWDLYRFMYSHVERHGPADAEVGLTFTHEEGVRGVGPSPPPPQRSVALLNDLHLSPLQGGSLRD